MSSSLPLRRSTTDKVLAGVIGGIAENFQIDSGLLRVAYVVVSILSAAFPGILVYLLMWILIPKRS